MCTKCKNEPRVQYKNSKITWCRGCINTYQRKWKKTSTTKSITKKYTYPTKGVFVYAFFNINGQCVYVGRGAFSRTKAHKYVSSWWNKDLIEITMTCDNEWQAMEYEGKWGGRYLPTMNKDGYRHQLTN